MTSPQGITSGDRVVLTTDLLALGLKKGTAGTVKSVSSFKDEGQGEYFFVKIQPAGENCMITVSELYLRKENSPPLNQQELRTLNSLPKLEICVCCGNKLFEDDTKNKYCRRCET